MISLSLVIPVLFFSAIQSVLGVGILLFGTPTLLLMGYSYQETLVLILPSSIMISTLQIVRGRHLIDGKKEIYLYTLPAILIGLSIVIHYNSNLDIKYIVGSMLLFLGIIRFSEKMNFYLKRLLVKYKIVYYTVMGIVHGISNMGGGLLVILMSTKHEEKDTIRSNIAFVYLLFAVTQIMILFFIARPIVYSGLVSSLWLGIMSLMMYVISEKTIMRKIDKNRYNSLVTFLIFAYGIVSFIKIG